MPICRWPIGFSASQTAGKQQDEIAQELVFSGAVSWRIGAGSGTSPEDQSGPRIRRIIGWAALLWVPSQRWLALQGAADENRCRRRAVGRLPRHHTFA